jgi:hypoxanthine phosphoribosyltransferase
MGNGFEGNRSFCNRRCLSAASAFCSKGAKARVYQSAVLCHGIASVLQKPVYQHNIIRTSATESQTKKNRSDRWQNVEGRFEWKTTKDLSGKHLLLIDDVVTTGATLEACGRTILQEGSVKLSVAALCVHRNKLLQKSITDEGITVKEVIKVKRQKGHENVFDLFDLYGFLTYFNFFKTSCCFACFYRQLKKMAVHFFHAAHGDTSMAKRCLARPLLYLETMIFSKPSFCASATRCSMWFTARISPLSLLRQQSRCCAEWLHLRKKKAGRSAPPGQ